LFVWQEGYLWQPFTYMWLHGSFGHLAMNLLSLWMFGSPLALAWGPSASSASTWCAAWGRAS